MKKSKDKSYIVKEKASFHNQNHVSKSTAILRGMALEFPITYIMFFGGVVFSALGIALITSAGLGTSPVTSLAYVLTFIFPYSLGTFTLLVNLVMFLAQAVLLGKEFEKVQLLQIPFTLIFSICIDFWLYVISSVQVIAYMQQLIMLFLGCLSLGFGIALEVIPDVLILPGEGLVRAIAKRTEKNFGWIKMCFDVGLVFSAVVVSIICLGGIEGIREGTVIAALIVGGIAQTFLNRLRCIRKTSYC